MRHRRNDRRTCGTIRDETFSARNGIITFCCELSRKKRRVASAEKRSVFVPRSKAQRIPVIVAGEQIAPLPLSFDAGV